MIDNQPLEATTTGDAKVVSRPNTASVVSLLVLTAGVLSYLCSYAVANALVAAEVLAPWPGDQDPRPKWLISAFVSLLCAFCAAGMVARWRSKKQLQSIDAMVEEDGIPA